jgi:hypothetical protein
MKRITSVAALFAATAAAAAAAPPGPVGGVAEQPVATPARSPVAGAQSVRVVARSPLTLTLGRRTAGERLRLVVSVQGRVLTRVAVARADGTATVRLGDVVLRRCQPVYVRLLVAGRTAPVRLRIVNWPSLDCAPTT